MSGPSPTYKKIPLSLLEVSPSNVRRRETTVDIDELAHSLETFGLQQPIVVQPRGDRYEILIGQRRFLAAKQLGWEVIDAKVLPERLNELEAKAASFSENSQRRDLTPRDKADTCSYLLRQLGTVKAVANQLGTSEATVRKWLGYAAVPESIKALVDDGKISRPVATRIVESVENEATALAIAERIATDRPPVAERQRILDAAEQFSHRPAGIIFEKAAERRVETQIIFVLPERWAETIDAASRELSREPNDIAREATIEWLRQYVSTGNPE